MFKQFRFDPLLESYHHYPHTEIALAYTEHMRNEILLILSNSGINFDIWTIKLLQKPPTALLKRQIPKNHFQEVKRSLI